MYEYSAHIFGVEYYYDFGIGIPVNKYKPFTFDHIIAHNTGFCSKYIDELRDKFIAARCSLYNEGRHDEIYVTEIDGVVVVWEAYYAAKEIYFKHLPKIRTAVQKNTISAGVSMAFSFGKCPFSRALDELFDKLSQKYLTPYIDEVVTIKYVTETLPQPIAEEIVNCLEAIIERRFIRYERGTISRDPVWNSDRAKRCEVLYTIIERYGKKYACPFAPINLSLSWEDAAAETYAYVRDKMPNWREG